MPVTISVNLITGIVSFLLTLMILSYLIGDNPAFRVAVYIFVGVSAGYAAAVTWWQVLSPKVIVPLLNGGLTERVLALVALILGILLLMKLSPRTARLGSPSVAYLVGVGAAVAIGGAVMGTLLPQVQASFGAFDVSSTSQSLGEQLSFGILMLIGTVTTLIYFHFGAKSTPGGPRRSMLVVILSLVGQIFIAITLGALFAGVLTAALVAFIERLNFIWTFLANFF
ncbi:MAG: hypothetical protein ABIF04_05810 [Chloroflexota bacterium]